MFAAISIGWWVAISAASLLSCTRNIGEAMGCNVIREKRAPNGTGVSCHSDQDCEKFNLLCIHGSSGKCSCGDIADNRTLCLQTSEWEKKTEDEGESDGDFEKKYGVSLVVVVMCLVILPFLCCTECGVGCCFLSHLLALQLGYHDRYRFTAGGETRNHVPMEEIQLLPTVEQIETEILKELSEEEYDVIP